MNKIRHIQLGIIPAKFEVNKETNEWHLKGFILKKHLTYDDALEIIEKILHLDLQSITDYYFGLNQIYHTDTYENDLIGDLENLISGDDFDSIINYTRSLGDYYDNKPFTFVGVDLMLYLKDREYI